MQHLSPSPLWALTLGLCTSNYPQEGDRLRAADYVTGSVEVRQLRSVYKLSFTDIVRVNRFKPVGVQQLAPSDDGSDSSTAVLRRAEREQSANVRLYVFLTKKKAKTRMADLEETAFLLRLDVGKEGCICFGKSFGNFDQVLVQNNMTFMNKQHIHHVVIERLQHLIIHGRVLWV